MQPAEGVLSPVPSPVRSDGDPEAPEACNNVEAGEPPKKNRRRNEATPAKAAKYAADKEFEGHGLEFRGGTLYCTLCGKEVSAASRARVRQHIWRTQNPTGAEKASAAATGLTRHLDILLQRSKAPRTGVEAFFSRTTTVGTTSLNRRADVARALMAAGVPFNVLDNPLVLEVLESSPAPLGGRMGVAGTVPAVTTREFTRYKDVLKDRHVALCFDGSTVNHALEATLLRFIDAEAKIRTLAIGCKRVTASLTEESLAHVLNSHLQRVGVPLTNVLCAVADRGQPNAAAVQRLLGPEDVRDHAFKLSGCLAHSLDNAGKKMKAKLPVAVRFAAAFKRLRKSFVAKQEFQALTKQALPSYSATRWWSWHSFMQGRPAFVIFFLSPLPPATHSAPVQDVRRIWPQMGVFVRTLKARSVCTASTETLEAVMTEHSCKTRFTLEMELFILNAVADPFIKANPIMQGKKDLARRTGTPLSHALASGLIHCALCVSSAGWH